MVVALGPGKFYGSSLPRPRIYTDVKFNEERVDPPVSVLDPLMSWAQEAHWSMGGLSFKRFRLQGRIEGNVKKLKAEREKLLKKKGSNDFRSDDLTSKSSKSSVPSGSEQKKRSSSPPRAPIAEKRRRVLRLMDESEDEREIDGVNEIQVPMRSRFPARKLKDDFDRVAAENGIGEKSTSPAKSSEGVASRRRSRRDENQHSEALVEVVKKLKTMRKKLKSSGKVERNGVPATPSRSRTSPRLVKRGSK